MVSPLAREQSRNLCIRSHCTIGVKTRAALRAGLFRVKFLTPGSRHKEP